MWKALICLFLIGAGCRPEKSVPPVGNDREDGISYEKLLVLAQRLDSGEVDPFALKDTLFSIFRDTAPIRDLKTDSMAAEVFFAAGSRLMKAGSYAEARQCLERSLWIRKNRFPAQIGPVRENLYQLGLLCQVDGDSPAALVYFDELAASIPERSSLLFFKGRLRTGQVYTDMKEWRLALDHLTDTWELASDNEAVPPWLKSDLLCYISYCYRGLGHLEDAVVWGEKALIWADLIDPDEAARVHMAIANAFGDSIENLSPREIVASAALDRAVTHFEQARRHYSKRPESFSGEITLLSANLGELYRRAGNLEKAAAQIEGSLHALPRSSLSGRTMAHLFMNLGEIWFDRDSLSKARVCFDSALYFLTPAFQPGPESVIPTPRYPNPVADRSYMAILLNDMANACLSQYGEGGYQDHALRDRGIAIYDSLVVLINTIRGGYLTEDAKLDLAKNSRKVLHQAFDWYARLSARDTSLRPLLWERAFRISENSKAFALLESARINSYDGALPEDLAVKETRGMKALAGIEQEIILHWEDEGKREALEKQRLEAMHAMVLVKNELRDKAPSYFAIRYKSADLPVREIQQRLLDPGQGMVEYFCGDSTLNIFLITGDEFTVLELPVSRDSLGGLVDRINSFLSSPFPPGEAGKEQEREFARLGYQLYQWLLEPLKTEGLLRLIVIPDGPLNKLSFESLVTSPEGSIRDLVDNSRFVLHRFAVSYCFSANLLGLMKDKEIPSRLKKRVAVFGPAYNPAIAQTSHPLFKWVPSLQNMGKNQKSQMDGINDEAPARLYEGQQATKVKFLEACRENAYVQVIAHGFLDERDPDLSCVVFAQENNELDEDNLLLLKDLYAFRLNQELVGFSACKTASGVYREGEGNMSLARGLAYAGVRSFLTTLWDIPGDGVARIMPGFYGKLLKQGTPKDVVLREAKLEYLRGATLDIQMQPFQWAGIVLIGATGYDVPENNGLWGYAIGAVLLSGFFIYKWRRKKTNTRKAS